MIVVVGNPVYDWIVTPYLDTKGRILSGCSTNACIVDSLLGLKCGLTGCMADNYKERFEREMKEFDIDVVVQLSCQTGGFYLEYDVSGDRKLNLLGVADSISYFPEKYLDADVILVGPILGEVSLELVEWIRKKSGALMFLDPQGFVRQIKGDKAVRTKNPDMEEIVSLFDIVKPNEHEAKIMTGLDAREETEKICEILYSWGAEIAIVTLAEAGSMIYNGSEFFKIPAYKTLARDPTGAGDTYAGGFIFEYLKTRDLFNVGLFASCTASIVVENTGPQFPVNEKRVRKRIDELKGR
ncbi:MAG: PfkB family carbohydrate kinase [Candidatus Methanofastidiosia archaeon]